MTTLFKGTTTLSAELHRFKKLAPDFYAAFFNKFYEQDAHFHDWRLPLYFNMTSLIQLKKGQVLNDRKIIDTFILESQIAMRMYEHQWPLYFVHPELLRACLASDPAKGLNIMDLGLPHEGFSFVLPKGALSQKGHDVCFISVGRDLEGRKKGKFQMPGYAVELDVTSTDAALVITTFIPNNGESWTYRLTDEHINDIRTVPLDAPFLDTFGNQVSKQFSIVDDNLSHTLLTAVLNLICAIRVRPEVLTKERRIKQIRRERDKELWSPNVLGRTYRIAIQGGAEKGEHASPRMHWRRGHFREQGYGPRNLCATPECDHRLGQHAQATDEQGRLDWPTACLQPNCACTAYKLPDKIYRKYETIWLEPILVMAPEKEKDEQTKTTSEH